MLRAVRRRLAPLALVAMLLLALLPTLGRLAGGLAPACEAMPPAATPAPAHDAMSDMMAHMSPAEHRAHMAMMARNAAPKPSTPAPSPHGDHDCPYCPLLSGLASMSVPMWAPHAPIALAPWSVRAVAAPRLDAPVPALGAQGPPARASA